MKIKYALALILAMALATSAQANLFENIAREFARNQVFHILRHYPDLIGQVYRMQMMQQQQQQQQQQLAINQQPNVNSNVLVASKPAPGDSPERNTRASLFGFRL